MAANGVKKLVLVCLTLSLGEAAIVATGKQAKINPPLTDVKSDKKFFGPPFPADYPDDKRPSVDHAHLDKLRPAGEPYPKLQQQAHYDTDYVKDENNDGGAWKAQFEYDNIRRKVAEEEAAQKRAEQKAAEEKKEFDESQKKADDAAKKVDDASKDEDSAKKDEDNAEKSISEEEAAASEKEKAAKNEADSKEKSNAETVEEMKDKVKEAEKKLEEQKKAFAECQKQLDDAKAEVETLKGKLKKYEDSSSADVKLWAEEKERAAASRQKDREHKVESLKAKSQAAKQKVEEAAKKKKELQEALEKQKVYLAKEKAESDEAHSNLLKHQAAVAKAKADLENARLHLQGLRGNAATPVKSATITAAPLSVVCAILLSARFFF